MLHWLVLKANLEGCIWPPNNQCIISLPLWFETNHVPLLPCNKRQWKPYHHIMWWGVVKSKEFVDPKKPQNRVSTFEFWYLHGFPLSCRHDELSEPYLLFFFGAAQWKLLWMASWVLWAGFWIMVGYGSVHCGFKNILMCWWWCWLDYWGFENILMCWWWCWLDYYGFENILMCWWWCCWMYV